jgi:hypothetical protein
MAAVSTQMRTKREKARSVSAATAAPASVRPTRRCPLTIALPEDDCVHVSHAHPF